jgi:N4-gp56 family major capsid protein
MGAIDGQLNMTATTNAVFIPSIWSAKVNDFYRANLVCANFFDDMSDDVVGGGNIVYIPNISQMTANTKAVGSQVTLNKPTSGNVTLTVNTWKEVSFLIEDAVAAFMKTSYRMQEKFAKNAGFTVAATLEDALMNLFNGFSQVVGTSAKTLQDSDIRQAIAYLDAADVPQGDRAFFLHPTVVWTQLMGIDRFTLVQNTNGSDPVMRGANKSIYGIPLFISSRCPIATTDAAKAARAGALCGTDALAYATANVSGGTSPDKIRLQSQYLQEWLGTLVTADILFGVIENRDEAGVLIKTSS